MNQYHEDFWSEKIEEMVVQIPNFSLIFVLRLDTSNVDSFAGSTDGHSSFKSIHKETRRFKT